MPILCIYLGYKKQTIKGVKNEYLTKKSNR